MGLDVYLYKHDDIEAEQRLEAEYEAFSNSAYAFDGRKYEELSQEEKEGARAKCKEFAVKLGLGEWGEYPGKQKLEQDSRLYSDHYFKVGYFRSSYNSGGIDRLLRDLIGKDLSFIFEPGDEYMFQPNWSASRERAITVIEELKGYVARYGSAHGVKQLAYNEFSCLPMNHPIDNAEAALKVYLKHLEQERERAAKNPDTDKEGYSNIDGEFYFNGPLQIKGIISGVNKRFFVNEKLPAFYLIFDRDITWYIQALEIVIETCEWVLEQPDKDKLYLHWSS